MASDRSVEIIERTGGRALPDRDWWARWRAAVGNDLLGGYGTLCQPRRGHVIELDVHTLWGPSQAITYKGAGDGPHGGPLPDRGGWKAFIQDPATGAWSPVTAAEAERLADVSADGKVALAVGQPAGDQVTIDEETVIRVTAANVASAFVYSWAPVPAQVLWAATPADTGRIADAWETLLAHGDTGIPRDGE